MNDPKEPSSIEPDRPRNVNITGGKGLVIGDHNTVNQYYPGEKLKFPTPSEAPPITADVVGREALIKEVQALLMKPDGAPIIALCGMGGIGKSTLAAVLSSSPSIKQAFPDGCFWVDLQGGDTLEALARMAQAYGQNVESYENVGSRSRAVRSVMADKRVFLVLDDAWQESEVSPFSPANAESRALVTTRDEGLASSLTNQVVSVERLDSNTAVEMLVQMVGSLPAPEERETIAALVEQLGGLPLALELVGKQARKEARRPGFSWQAIRQRFAEASKRLGLGRGEQTVRGAFDQTWARALDEETRRRFALLGVFPRGDFLTGAIAAAWNAGEDALETLGELLDLSLVRQVDLVNIRLHPLLQDFAEEKLQGLSEDERTAAHQRVSDYDFERAPENPTTWADIQPVLSSHNHAALAHDKERARRVFPWFKLDPGIIGRPSVPVPGFLIDRGYQRTLVHHYQIELEFARAEGQYQEAYAEYWLADSLGDIGEIASAAEHLNHALAIADSWDASAGKDAARSKFSFRLGQLLAEFGDFDKAIASYQTAVEIDRRNNQIRNSLTGMLQIGDLYLQRRGPADSEEAIRVYEEVRELAQQHQHSEPEVMALTRLAELAQQTEPERAIQYVQAALYEKSAFSGRQGTRYATRLGKVATNLLYNGHTTLSLPLTAFSMAIESGSDVERSTALYWLGNLFENLFLAEGHVAQYPAAWACYSLAAQSTSNMELPPGINPQERLETRVLPEMDTQKQESLRPRIESAPLEIIQEAIDRLMDG